MKLKNILTIGVILLIVACNNDEYVSLDIDGEYIGTFQRDDTIAHVEIELIDGTFSGRSFIKSYVKRTALIPIYYGEYFVKNNIIVFDNKVVILPLVYDPSTLLDGKWNFSFENNILNMKKANGDRYVLQKQ